MSETAGIPDASGSGAGPHDPEDMPGNDVNDPNNPQPGGGQVAGNGNAGGEGPGGPG